MTASPIRKAVRIKLATISSLGDPGPTSCIGRAIGSPWSETYISCGKMANRAEVGSVGLSSPEDGVEPLS
jgi:hypothetical protein